MCVCVCVSGDKSGPALPALTGPGQETRVWPAEERSAAAAPRGRRPSGPAPPLPSSRCRTGRLQPLLLISLRLQPGKTTPARLRSSSPRPWGTRFSPFPARLPSPPPARLALPRSSPRPAPAASSPALIPSRTGPPAARGVRGSSPWASLPQPGKTSPFRLPFPTVCYLLRFLSPPSQPRTASLQISPPVHSLQLCCLSLSFSLINHTSPSP